MAITRAYGWDCGNTMVTASDNSGFTVSTSQKKTGGYSGYMTNASYTPEKWMRAPLEGTPADPSASIWIRPDAGIFSGGAACTLSFVLDSGKTIALMFDGTDHTWDAYVDGVKVADGTVYLHNYDVWVHVQFYAVIADVGSIQVKIDGHLSVDYSGDTLPGAETGATYFKVGCAGGTQAYSCYFDDLAVGYGGFLGDIRCIDIRPTADTAVDDWTPSSGDNYSTIDETPPSDVDYNETNTDAQADELALGDFDGVTYTPVAITAWARAWMLAATGDSLKVGIDSGGVDDVTQSALATAVEYLFHTADQNPDGPVAWDDAAIDALLYRYESVIA